MLLVDRQTVPATLREKSAARLKLRVREGGQILELSEGKTTIGSSPRCNLRLDGPGVEPMHCLIFEGPEGLRVRRWAADTRVNGERVEDASLEAGDRLSLGCVELELVGPVATVKLPEARLPETRLPQVKLPELTERLIADELADGGQEEVASVVEKAAAMEAVSPTDVVEIPRGWTLVETAGDEVDTAALDIATTHGKVVSSPGALEVISRLEVDDIGYFDAGLIEDRDSSATEELGEEEEAPSDLPPVEDAVEQVFRELQAACAVARGRNRKMLAALRSLRAEKRDLARRLEDGVRAGEIDAECANWEAPRQNAERDEQDLLGELKELRRELGEWESRLADHTRQMADLQQELAEVRALRPAFAGDLLSANAGKDNAVESAALQTVDPAENPRTGENTSTSAEAWESLPINATKYDAPVEEARAAINEFRAEDVHADLLSDANNPRKSRIKADLGTAILESWESPSEAGIAKADWAGPDKQAQHSSDPTAAENNSVDAAWDFPDERKVDWATPSAPSHRENAEVADESWSVAATADDSHDENSFGNIVNREAVRAEQAEWESNTAAEVEPGGDDVSPFAGFSIWKQGALPDSARPDGNSTPQSDASDATGYSVWGNKRFQQFQSGDENHFEKTEGVSVSEDPIHPWAVAAEKMSAASAVAEADQEFESLTAPAQPSSFIERYSHLFADEKESTPAEKGQAPITPPPKPRPEPISAITPASPAAASGDEDEESIEQYMAKLMKRVRGESPVAAPSPAELVAAKEETQPAPSAAASHNPVATREEANPNSDAVPSEEEHPEVAVNWDAFARRASTVPKTDLGALRAIANATARQDISHYQLKKHRRDATTKVIVSTLAGMTSLWLMLEAPNWRDTQFITACISLVVAAYWAGEAFREMVKSMRAAYDAPRVSDTDEIPLPIDVH